jgi:hypothetical protein
MIAQALDIVQSLHNLVLTEVGPMPTIHRLSNSRLCIFADDHDPPHFHTLGPGWSGVIDLGTLTLRRGAIPKRDFLEAVQWATDNRLFLLSEWKRLNERD